MAHMESLWPGLAELPLVVESCEYDRLHAVLAHEFQRVTTHVRPVGAGADGLGEDVSVHVEDGSSLHETQPALPLAGEWTLRRLLRSPRDARSAAQAAGVGGGAALSQLGVRVGGAGPRVAPGRPCPARRAWPRAAAGALRQLAGPRRAALDRARAPGAAGGGGSKPRGRCDGSLRPMNSARSSPRLRSWIVLRAVIVGSGAAR